MFRRVAEIDRPVMFEFEDRAITAQEGDTIAAALLAAGIVHFRYSAEDQSPRGPYCMIGNCFECLVAIDGMGSRQACRERVEEGMRVRAHCGHASLEAESEA